MLTSQKIKYFQKLYEKEYGEKISYQDALELAQKLVNFYKIIFPYIPETDEQAANQKN